MIDENLKKVYEDMLDQEVPDRFLELLSQLKDQDEKSGKTGREADE
ncbi:NepR family anti-sigma factor [Roseivivax lentus]|nr:NepR family anti-sigma factor [Roseivivax lentus]